jgi:pectinesterase
MRGRVAVVLGFTVAMLAAGTATALAWPGPYVTVAPDGSADFTTIQAAVDAIPDPNPSTFTIKIQPGVYSGQVIIPASKP